jgi:fatty acid synthase subunit beta
VSYFSNNRLRTHYFHSYNVNFVKMVLPGDKLTAEIKHTAMRDGNFVVGVTTINQRREKVLEGAADVDQPTTFYAFTGQGSQVQGMGMDLYSSSPAARAVWESTNTYLISAYGFSIVEIVCENPKKRRSTSAVSRARQSVSAIWR